MTVGNGSELALNWLHCNECHRSFEHHNRLSDDNDNGLRVLRSDLPFSFTSCGHFFCEHCIQQHTVGGKLVCTLCHQDVIPFKVDTQVPKMLEMYLKPPTSQLEDSISFQITNANLLIKSLRAKVAQQKDLISKAKQELASQKLVKELDDVSRAAGTATPMKLSQSPIPAIHAPGRLSLKSPIRVSQVPSIQMQPNHHLARSWPTQRSPTISEICVRQPSVERGWNIPPSHSQKNTYYDQGLPDTHHLTQPIYATPESRIRGTFPPSYSRTFPIPSRSQSQRIVNNELPPSPRPVFRHPHTVDLLHSNRNSHDGYN